MNAAETKAREDQIRTSVMDYMHYDGCDRWRLDDHQWCGVYLLADGFGSLTIDQAVEQCYDWSHVRDSSEAALSVMWDAICSLHNRAMLKTANDSEARLNEWWAKQYQNK